MIDRNKKGLVTKTVKKQVKLVEKQPKVFSVKSKTGEKLYLHENKTYYFSKTVGKNAVEAKPVGRKVKRNKSGFPFLARV